jgi:hypothetical protein
LLVARIEAQDAITDIAEQDRAVLSGRGPFGKAPFGPHAFQQGIGGHDAFLSRGLKVIRADQGR